jgi:hypothetical protein
MEGKLKRNTAFRKQDEPVEHVVIDRSAMNEIRDRAHKIYMQTLRPDAVLVMFQALKDYMEKRGAKANFTVEGENK